MKLPFEEIERKIIIKKAAKTNSKFKVDVSAKSLIDYGVVNIDKPSGPTSHLVTDYVKKILRVDKAGHSGTLDPKTTGVLPTTLGRSTRIVEYLLKAGKEYIALMHLHKEISEKSIKAMFKKYTGKIRQMPPVKSSVRRKWRSRNIYYIEILEINGQDVLFKVGCEAGTYIRKLIHNIGESLGCGAHMVELRRTKVACFTEKTLVTLHDLADAYHYYKQGDEKEIKKIIQPIENAVKHLPKIWINDSSVEPLCHGTNLMIPGIIKFNSKINKDDIIAVLTLKEELVCLGKAMMTCKEIKKAKKGIAVRVDKVFMLPGVYK